MTHYETIHAIVYVVLSVAGVMTVGLLIMNAFERDAKEQRDRDAPKGPRRTIGDDD
jgi:hypothetical protein